MSYLDMVSTLLMFTRGETDGIWDLYLYAFRCMLPWFFRYDHTNYARWGAVYLADTKFVRTLKSESSESSFCLPFVASL
jgi:hypothetical protein